MNILVIPTNDWTRAAGAGHINSIAQELAERGHNVYAWNFDLCRNQPAKRETGKVKLIKPKTLPLRDPAVFFALNAFFQAPAVFKAIKDLKIDVVINENILSGLVAFLVAGNGALKVFDFSDYFPESASVYYTGSSQIAKKLVEAVTLAVTKLNVKASNTCLAVCQSLIKTAQVLDENKPCYLVTNGVNTCNSTLATQNTSEKTAAPSMVVMGVIDEWLDLETPLHALKTLIKRHPNLKLIVIGPWQKNQFRQRFEENAKNLNLTSQVEVTGYISSQKLKSYLEAATCCIMPYQLDRFYSLIRLPEKLFVYSAYGKTILSTRLPEVHALHDSHILFYNNAEELASKAELVLSNGALRESLARNACSFAGEHDFKVLAQNLEQILTEQLRKLRAT